MATLEKIRSKAGLLVIVVGVALFAFIIGDFLQSGSTFFRQSKEKIANVDGKTIDVREYQAKIAEMEDVYKLQSGMTSLPENVMDQIRESAYQTMVRQIVMANEADEIGLSLSKDELSNMIMGDNISPMIRQMPMFQNPQTGNFDKNELLRFLKVIESDDYDSYAPEQQEQLLSYKKFWLFWERNIKDQRLEEKYNNLLSKAVAANSLDAKDDFYAKTLSADFEFVLKRYSSVPDDQFTVTDAEIKKYFEENKERYRQEQDAQVLNLISVSIEPSSEDYKSVLSRMEAIYPAFSSQENIADLIKDNSDEPFFDAFQSLSNLPRDVKEFLNTAEIGDVRSPYLENNTYVMTKVLDKTTAPDSIKLNQIMLPARTESELNHYADSLLNVINSGTPFADVARSLTNNQIDGDMGWTTELDLLKNSDEKFKNGAFDAPLNKAVIVKSHQGTHIVQITEKTTPVVKYKLADIKIKVNPSNETYKKLYNDLSQYAATYNNVDSFKMAASSHGYFVHRDIQITKGDQNVQGIPKSRPLVRWAFEHKKGDISDIFDFESVFVVAMIEKSLKKGYRPVEVVADMIKRNILDDKKAEFIIEDANKKAYPSLEQYATDFNGNVQDVKFVTFSTSNITGVGQEPMLNAMAFASEVGKISSPIKGNAGIYIIKVTNQKESEAAFNAAEQKKTIDGNNNYRIGYQSFNYLIKSYNIEDNRIIYY